MPAPHPPEFWARGVTLTRTGEFPVSKIAKDPGISDSCLRSWMAQADDGRRGTGCRRRRKPSWRS
jgi:transposase-like protein